MEARGHAGLGVNAVRHVARHLEAENARDFRCQRDRLEIEHQLRMVGVGVGHADRGARQLPLLTGRVELLDFLDAAFHFADVIQIIRQPRAVGGTDLFFQPIDRGHQAVENALVFAAAARPFLRSGARAEQLIEHRARIAQHRQRLGRRGPTDGVGVNAGIVVFASAGLILILYAQLHRRNRRVLAEALGVDLVQRRPRHHIGAHRLFRMRLRQEDGGGAKVIAADLGGGECLGLAAIGVADNRQVIAERLEWRQAARRQIKPAPGVGRRPQVGFEADVGRTCGAMHHLQRDQPGPAGLGRRGPGHRRRGGNHRVEQGQAQ